MRAACRRPDAPAGGGKGWELSWTLTTPLVPPDERDAPIELGELLGAGSFGEWQLLVSVVAHDALVIKLELGEVLGAGCCQLW